MGADSKQASRWCAENSKPPRRRSPSRKAHALSVHLLRHHICPKKQPPHGGCRILTRV
jgi:hypothetical protein